MNPLVTEWFESAEVLPDAAPSPELPPEAKPLSALVRHIDSDPDELLKHRFLCRGASLLMVGPTGIGKSSLSMQAMILCAIGKPMFGIQPVKPLKSLLIQAENDDGDLAEMRDGVMNGMNLTAEERDMAMQNIIVGIQQASEIMNEIATASSEQASGIEQVNRAVMQMEDVTQQNAALVEQAAAAAESMREQAEGLSVLVSRFKLDDQKLREDSVRARRHAALAVAPAAPQTAKRLQTRDAPAKLPTEAAGDGEWTEY